MNILIIGSGAREHALAMEIAQNDDSKKVIVSPGNPGMKTHEKIEVLLISENELPEYCKHFNIGLVVIGPEAPLANGLSDQLRQHNITVFGPSRDAAQLEASKDFCKRALTNANIASAKYLVANNVEETNQAINELFDEDGIVLKADGLASGKGVVVCRTKDHAFKAGKLLLEKFNQKIIVEKVVQGKEVSAMYLCLGTNFIPLGFACDHKRLLDDDLGPNTGGMGAYSPVPWLNEKLKVRIDNEVIKPILAEMTKQNCTFNGLLFAGLMIDKEYINVLEFNVRFGDPETQTVLPLLNWNIVKALKSVAENDLTTFINLKITTNNKFSVHVVKASEGYPDSPILNREIDIKNSPQLYFAGVKLENEQLLTNGGRVLGATGIGDSFDYARKQAYEYLDSVTFDGAQFRSDIGSQLC